MMLTALTLVAAGLTVFALRGRRVDDHPLCRGCGFDLFGKPETSTACAECGADLTRRRATRVGHRERRGRLLGVAVPALLVGVAAQGWVGWKWARGVEWNRHKPEWWLVRSLDSPDPAHRDAAFSELTRRITANELTPATERRLVERGLALPADWSKSWVVGWGDIIEAVGRANRLEDRRWVQYVLYSQPLELVPRQIAYFRCDALEFDIRAGAPRVSQLPADWEYNVNIQATSDEFELNGVKTGESIDDVFYNAQRPEEISAPRERSAALPYGSHSARLRLQLKGELAKYDEERGTRRTGRFTVSLDLTTSWTLTPMPEPVNDAALRGPVERALSVERVELARRAQPGLLLASFWDSFQVHVRCDGAPVTLVYDVLLRPDGKGPYQTAGSMCFARGTPGRASVTTEPLRSKPVEPQVRTVDVWLRPNLESAPRYWAQKWNGEKTVWTGEVLIPGVPVELVEYDIYGKRKQPPATQPR